VLRTEEEGTRLRPLSNDCAGKRTHLSHSWERNGICNNRKYSEQIATERTAGTVDVKDAPTMPTRADRNQFPCKNHSFRVGRVQRQIKRAFIASNGQPLTSTELLRWCWPRERRRWHYKELMVAASRFARRIGRSQTGSGRAYLWAPK
jgi:hypothetical protein